VRLIGIALMGWSTVACKPPVTYPPRTEPFHAAVGCWALTSTDANDRVRAQLLPGPVLVEFTAEPERFLHSPPPERHRQVNFHLRVRKGLRGYLITTWTPISYDSVSFGWTFGGASLSMVGSFTGDSVVGSGGLGFDVGGCCPFRFGGIRSRCVSR
jgi:hypothetical protein